MADLQIYRSGAVFRTVKIGLDTVYQGQFMAENKIVANFSSPSVIKFKQGDYIIHKGQEWRLNEMPSESRSARNKLAYTAVFEGREYTWYNKQLMHLGVSDFSYFGTPLELVQLLVTSINEIDPGWLIGTVDNTAEPQHFNFKDQSCRQALTTVAEAFGMEFQFSNRTLNFKNTIGTVVPGVTLSYGMHNGLYSLTRQPATDAKVATRVFGYGSTQNIPADYRGGLSRLTFSERHIDNNITEYGVIETSITFDDIRPERTASITGTANSLTVTDSTLDFDLNSVIVKGQAKIVFKSGDLQGNEFLITSYNHSTKTIRFEANKEENGRVFPSGSVKPAVGDQYTLIGIIMPQSYIDAAEARVKQETINYANSIKKDNFLHQLAIDQIEAKANGLDVSLKLGDKLHVVDAGMGIDETLRVQSLTYPIVNPAKITATISDKVTYTRAERIRQIIAKQEEAIREIIKSSAELQRINSVRREELQDLIFDPDGYFDTGKIKPLSIETTHIAVGSRSQEYSLSVIFKPNFNGDANRIDWTSGVLTHFTIADTIKTWNIAQGTRSGLANGTAYYIYARCSKTGTTGTIVLDTVQRKVNDDANFYYFLVGVLSSNIDGIRWPTLTYGTTEINGGFVRTGRIESNDGKAYFDLTTNQFFLGDTTSSVDWNVTVPNQLTIVGHIVATSGNIGGIEINPVTGKLEISLQKVTEAGSTTDRIITARGVRAQQLLEVPGAAPLPADMVTDKVYVWGEKTGNSSEPSPVISNLEDLQNVADSIPTGQYLFKDTDGIWKGKNVPVPDLSGYAKESWVTSQLGNYVPASRTVNGKPLTGNISLTANDVGAITQAAADGRYVTIATKQEVTGAKRFSKALGLPDSVPASADMDAGAVYIWSDGTGGGSTPSPSSLYLGDLLDVNITNPVNKQVLQWNGTRWVNGTVDIPSLAGYAKESWVEAGYYNRSQSDDRYLRLSDARISNWTQAYNWGDFRDFGLGESIVVNTDWFDVNKSQFFYNNITGVINAPANFSSLATIGIQSSSAGSNMGFLSIRVGGLQVYVGRKNAGNISWNELWHDGNLRSDSQNDARYSQLGHTHTFASLTSKPTTLSGYGITDAVTINTKQSITGAKRFTAALGLPSSVPSSANMDAGAVYIWSDGAGGGSTPSPSPNYLRDLLDVTITSPAVDQVLRWNGTRWVNSNEHVPSLSGYAKESWVQAGYYNRTQSDNRYLLNASNTVQVDSSIATDLNDQRNSLVYGNASPNRPFGFNSTVLSLFGIQGYGGQIGFTLHNSRGLAYRKSHNGIWTEWREVWDTHTVVEGNNITISGNTIHSNPSLSLGTSGGRIDISGSGSGVNLADLLSDSDKQDASSRLLFSMFKPYRTVSGMINYPTTAVGHGIRSERFSTNTSQMGFDIYHANGVNVLYFKTFRGTSDEDPWQIFASREWTSDNFYSQVQANARFVGLTGNESISGNKTFLGQSSFSHNGYGSSLNIHRDGSSSSAISAMISYSANEGGVFYAGFDVVTGDFGITSSAIRPSLANVFFNANTGNITTIGRIESGGNIVSGQNLLVDNGYARFRFQGNTWYGDSNGAERMYIGIGSASTAGILFKAIHSLQQFQLRDADNVPTTFINMTNGDATFTGNMSFEGTTYGNPAFKANGIYISNVSAPSATSGASVRGRDHLNGDAFLLRNYTQNGYQLALNLGGIDAVGNINTTGMVQAPIIKATRTLGLPKTAPPSGDMETGVVYIWGNI